eukprot:Blabericola_migrator_1__2555@NODE_1720_length_3927_cov_39_093782_g1112_i0_p1_GENE_NODE_1720_length_3927_cov_39_093782_g1112_i0NODE_1720_length_3927_cov_39_093782_g1112_i0_p1_ORF_typecomplete_len639_score118_70dbPDZ_assoc/PF16610_5/4_8_NODE_1720_length_3927_cov_39_093782_g1112_i013723288
MSAKCIQAPSPITAAEYKRLGATIVATLAIGPGIPSGVNPPQNDSTIDTAVAKSGGATGTHPSTQSTSTSIPIEVSTSDHTDPFRSLRSSFILADFSKSEVPLFLEPRTKAMADKSTTITEILNLIEEGEVQAAETRVQEEFSLGDFEEHLCVGLRKKLLNYKPGTIRDWGTSLYTPYVKGLMNWCADDHDALVEQIKLAYKCSRSTAADLGMTPDEYNAAISNHRFFEKVSGAYHDQVERLRITVLSDKSTDLYKAWKVYQKQRKAGQNFLAKLSSYFRSPMSDDAQFVSWLLRNAPPEVFLTTRLQMGEVVRMAGGDFKLVSVLYLLRLHEADVAELMIKEAMELGKPEGTHDSSVKDKVSGASQGLSEILSLQSIDESFDSSSLLPPFLQSVVPVESPNFEAVNQIANLVSKGKKDEANILMQSRFPMGDFHAHFFNLLKKNMRSYKLIPPRRSGLLFPTPVQTYTFKPKSALGNLMVHYAEGFKRWCSELYDHHVQGFEEKLMNRSLSPEALETYNSIASELVSNMTFELRRKLARYSQDTFQEIAELPVELNQFRRNAHSINWMLLNMPWDSFLFYRLEFARLVRAHSSSTEGLGFLANVLESLSFTAEDELEFQQYCQRVKKQQESAQRQKE